MKQNLNLICEAKLSLGKMADEGENPSGMIEAKVTTFGPREGADGRKFFYKPEGFAQWADEFANAGKPLPMFLNHNDMGMPVGQWDEFTMEDDGMSAKGKIYMNTVGGSDLYSVLKEAPNMFGGVSVGAYADEARMVDEQGNPMGDDEDEGYFQITKGGLREVSVVMYPNNPNAEIQRLEYFDKDGNANPRLIERTLRDAGLSKKDATTASSILKKVLEMRDVSSELIEKKAEHGDHDAVETEANNILKALEERELLKAISKRIK
jgi:HK97 family phage prohead protease